MLDAEQLVKSIVVPHTAFQNGLTLLGRHIETAKKRLAWKAAHPEAKMNDSPHVILLTGESGTGKSFLLDHAGKDLQEVHTSEGWTIPSMYAKMPPKPSPITMLERILWAMHTSEERRRSEEYLSRRVIKLINECETAVVFLDELQHLVDRRTSRVWQHATDVVKDLSDQTWALYVLSGIPRGSAAINQNQQLKSRVRARIELTRFDWTEPKSRAEFIGCLEAFHKELVKHAKIPLIFEPDWAFRLYCATGGLMRPVTNLLIELLTAHGGKKKIDLAEFADVYGTLGLADKQPSESFEPFNAAFLQLPREQVLATIAHIGEESDEVEERRRQSTPKGGRVLPNPKAQTRRGIPRRFSPPRRSKGTRSAQKNAAK